MEVSFSLVLVRFFFFSFSLDTGVERRLLPPYPTPVSESVIEAVIHECSTGFVQSTLFHVSGQIVNCCLQVLVSSAEVSIFLARETNKPVYEVMSLDYFFFCIVFFCVYFVCSIYCLIYQYTKEKRYYRALFC